MPLTGTLRSWNDDRGFGFISEGLPDRGASAVGREGTHVNEQFATDQHV